MIKKVEKYLEQIQQDESIFPMDSFDDPKKKKNDVLRTQYPQSYTEEFNEDDAKHMDERIMVDVDGVLHTYEKGWNDGKLEGVMKGAGESLKELHNMGFEIVIFSTRAAGGENSNTKEIVQDLEKWLQENDLYYDFITGQKLGALCYIDDRAIHFTDWQSALEEVKKRAND